MPPPGVVPERKKSPLSQEASLYPGPARPVSSSTLGRWPSQVPLHLGARLLGSWSSYWTLCVQSCALCFSCPLINTEHTGLLILWVFIPFVFKKTLYVFRAALGSQQNWDEGAESSHVPPAPLSAFPMRVVPKRVVTPDEPTPRFFLMEVKYAWSEMYTHIFNSTSQKYNSTGFVKCICPEPNMSVKMWNIRHTRKFFLDPCCQLS